MYWNQQEVSYQSFNSMPNICRPYLNHSLIDQKNYRFQLGLDMTLHHWPLQLDLGNFLYTVHTVYACSFIFLPISWWFQIRTYWKWKSIGAVVAWFFWGGCQTTPSPPWRRSTALKQHPPGPSLTRSCGGALMTSPAPLECGQRLPRLRWPLPQFSALPPDWRGGT